MWTPSAATPFFWTALKTKKAKNKIFLLSSKIAKTIFQKNSIYFLCNFNKFSFLSNFYRKITEIHRFLPK